MKIEIFLFCLLLMKQIEQSIIKLQNENKNQESNEKQIFINKNSFWKNNINMNSNQKRNLDTKMVYQDTNNPIIYRNHGIFGSIDNDLNVKPGISQNDTEEVKQLKNQAAHLFSQTLIKAENFTPEQKKEKVVRQIKGLKEELLQLYENNKNEEQVLVDQNIINSVRKIFKHMQYLKKKKYEGNIEDSRLSKIEGNEKDNQNLGANQDTVKKEEDLQKDKLREIMEKMIIIKKAIEKAKEENETEKLQELELEKQKYLDDVAEIENQTELVEESSELIKEIKEINKAEQELEKEGGNTETVLNLEKEKNLINGQLEKIQIEEAITKKIEQIKTRVNELEEMIQKNLNEGKGEENESLIIEKDKILQQKEVLENLSIEKLETNPEYLGQIIDEFGLQFEENKKQLLSDQNKTENTEGIQQQENFESKTINENQKQNQEETQVQQNIQQNSIIPNDEINEQKQNIEQNSLEQNNNQIQEDNQKTESETNPENSDENIPEEPENNEEDEIQQYILEKKIINRDEVENLLISNLGLQKEKNSKYEPKDENFIPILQESANVVHTAYQIIFEFIENIPREPSSDFTTIHLQQGLELFAAMRTFTLAFIINREKILSDLNYIQEEVENLRKGELMIIDFYNLKEDYQDSLKNGHENFESFLELKGSLDVMFKAYDQKVNEISDVLIKIKTDDQLILNQTEEMRKNMDNGVIDPIQKVQDSINIIPFVFQKRDEMDSNFITLNEKLQEFINLKESFEDIFSQFFQKIEESGKIIERKLKKTESANWMKKLVNYIFI